MRILVLAAKEWRLLLRNPHALATLFVMPALFVLVMSFTLKNTLVAQRKVVRAAGRDTGDAMKLSRDKINDISHKVVATVRKSHEFRVKKDANEVRLEIVKFITDLLLAEDKVDRAARDKIRSQKREIAEGTEEWGLLHRRYYAEELKKLGIDLAR